MHSNFKIQSEAGSPRYYCPMHCEGDRTYDKPGTCPVCNMFLVPVESKGTQRSEVQTQHNCNCHGNNHEKDNSSRQEAKIVYYCPMHCEGDKTYDKPGTCPICNMFLVAGLSDVIKKKVM